MRLRRNKQRRPGFTLVEILIATSIFAIVTVGLTRLMIQLLSIYHYDTGKILVNRDIRKFTMEMTENATYANYFKIFPSYTSISRTVDTYVNVADPEAGFTTAAAANYVPEGQSGDCLVLVYKDPADDRIVSRLIIYYRVGGTPSPTPAAGIKVFNRGALRKLEITPNSMLPILQLIPEIPNPTANPIVLQSVGVQSPTLVQVPGSNPATFQSWGLFYNFFDQSVILKGELIQTGAQINTKNVSATNTYNFTISPRG